MRVFIILTIILLPLMAFGQIEYIIQYDDGNSVYYSGRPLPGDTVGVWFEQPSECQILAGQFQFNNGMGGDALVYVWDLRDDFNPDNYYDNDEPGASPGPTPLGQPLVAGIPYNFDGGDWEEIVFDDWGYPPEELNVELNPFYIGFVLQGTGAEPYYPSLLGDAEDDRPYHSIAWLTNPGGSYPGQSGWWAYGIDWMLRARVNLYGDPPPEITNLDDPPDTYLEGPYTITCTVTDDHAGGEPGVVEEVRLYYTIPGSPEEMVLMSNVSGDDYAADIPAVTVNGTINFRVEAEDDNAGVTIFPNENGYYFTYRQPSGASILLVNDAANHDYEDIYRNALENHGFSYDFWYIDPAALDEEDMGYPGSDVISIEHYNSIIWFTGPGYGGTLPDNDADLSVDRVANFMDEGGNFFLSSMDYLGTAFNPNQWTEFLAEEGSFMYEYLKVMDGWSDAHLSPYTGQSLDTLHVGIENDPISGQFYPAGLMSHPDPNYNDFCYPLPEADRCFETEIDQESAGIRFDGDYKMVFLPWMLEAADNVSDAETVIMNVLDFFIEGAGPSISLIEGSRYGIYGDTPHAVTVAAADPEGIDAALLHYRFDGGDWTTNTIIHLGADRYQAEIDAPMTWDDCDYYISATNLGGFYDETQEFSCYHTYLNYNGTTSMLYCSDQPYAGIYHPSYDSTVTASLEAIPSVADFQTWDVTENGPPDYWTVLQNYQYCIWVGYADWMADHFPMKSIDNPFCKFIDAGGAFLFSSSEMWGTWTSWVDVDFEPGDFACDYLGVSHLYNDLGYENLDVQPHPLTTGLPTYVDLIELAFPLYGDCFTPQSANSTFFSYGNMAEGFSNNTEDNSVITLGFSLFEMPQDELNQFVGNVVIEWMAYSPGDYTVSLMPSQVPIEIGQNGGTFDYVATVYNHTGNAETHDLWTEVEYPNGSVISPLMGPYSATLESGNNNWYRIQAVPGNAPAGTYIYTGFVGSYPNEVIGSAMITFEKLTSGDGPRIDEWDNWGDPIGDELDNAALLPEKFALHEAYPNPFNPTTTIQYDLPEAVKVSLKVYNLQGQVVATLVDGFREAGYHEVLFNAQNLSSGMYFYHIQAGQFSDQGKLVLLK